MNKRDLFKKVGKHHNKHEEAIRIRKENRDEMMRIAREELGPPISHLYSRDHVEVLRNLREIVSLVKSSTVTTAQIIDMGIVLRLLELVTSPCHEIQVESSWLLSNIAASQAGILVKAGCMPLFIWVLKSSLALEVQVNIVWCLGNIISHSVESRNLFIEGIPFLVAFYQSGRLDLLWVVTNIVRFEYPLPVGVLFPVGQLLLEHINTINDPLLREILAIAKHVIRQGVSLGSTFSVLVVTCMLKNENFIIAALECAIELVIKGEFHSLWSAGIVNHLNKLLFSNHADVLLGVCQVLLEVSKFQDSVLEVILGVTLGSVIPLLQRNFISDVIVRCVHGIIINILTNGNQGKHLMTAEVLQSVCFAIDFWRDSDVILEAMNIIYFILDNVPEICLGEGAKRIEHVASRTDDPGVREAATKLLNIFFK